jgi:hypothetical protein
VTATVGFLQGGFERLGGLRNYLSKEPLRRARLLGLLDRLKLMNMRWFAPELTGMCPVS